MAKEQVQRQMIFTTILVDDATDKINDGVVVKRYQNPWLKSEVGLRRAGVTFKMTTTEQQEYIDVLWMFTISLKNIVRLKQRTVV